MDTKHLNELAVWLNNNIDVEAGIPVIFDDYVQEYLEEELRKGQ